MHAGIQARGDTRSMHRISIASSRRTLVAFTNTSNDNAATVRCRRVRQKSSARRTLDRHTTKLKLSSAVSHFRWNDNRLLFLLFQLLHHLGILLRRASIRCATGMLSSSGIPKSCSPQTLHATDRSSEELALVASSSSLWRSSRAHVPAPCLRSDDV